jgi:Kef-type K+ transport system membrane component KefB
MSLAGRATGGQAQATQIPARQLLMAETERRLLPAPARGLGAALGLITVAGLLAALALGWFASHHAPSHATAPLPAADPVQLLARVTLAVGLVCGVASMAGVLLRRIGQPPVVGEILAGLVLGPSVLSTLAPAVHQAVLPPQAMTWVNLTAQAGLAIFMFTVGAEFSPGELRGQRGVIGAAGLSMMAVPFALGALAAVPLLGSFAGPSAAPLPFVVFIGVALSVTAFPVLARIVYDAGLHATRLGALAMLCAAVTDVLAWCTLAVVLAMVHGAGGAGVLRTLALTGAVSAVCVLGLRPMVRGLSARYAGAALPGGLRLLVVLGLVVGLAAAADRIGVHAIFGGFMAGIVLRAGNPLFGETADHIGRLNRVLLVPVFFATIGMQVDIRLGLGHPAVLAGGALLAAVAVAGKVGSAAPVAWAGGMPVRSALALGALMNARGITEIVVLSIGLSAGVINGAAFTVLILMALLTTCMAAPALRMLGAWRRPGPGAGDRRCGSWWSAAELLACSPQWSVCAPGRRWI